MDLTTILGLLIGTFIFATAIMTRGDLPAFISIPSILITFGGAVCAMVIATPMKRLKKIVTILRKAFIHSPADPIMLISRLVRFGEIARRDGILALEGALSKDDDEFLVRGIQMAVDGSDPEFIYKAMSTELEVLEDRHKVGRKMFEALGAYAPAFGMIGTLIGLILMLRHLDDPSKIGPGMAVALITTLYGVMGANFVFLPLAEKLEARTKEELLVKEIIMQGVMAIQSGDNPRVVEQKLKIFLPPQLREHTFLKKIT
jgi:chemotaxis protein MotA